MPAIKILVIPGSIRTGSFNARLAALAAKEIALAGIDVTRISLTDYPLPIYDADLEVRSGAPKPAIDLKQMIGAHHGVLIVTPEYNASVPPLLKNAVDWVSRVRERGEPPLQVFHDRAFAIAAASEGKFGGLRALMALRQVLALGCGATVIPRQFALSGADQAFDDNEHLKDSRDAEGLRALVKQLIDVAQQMM
ncbi:NAD(P)H-dependent oxidoreductase [Bradyrhizobium prioriisuperbiae]|uniref:NADPH-dependent FMN reductase n=1 Tax=Bradyrhizobium prioriisuperbiae TaxID=2854389 RepID=UPI0028E286B6|nr:NAD(P)H-dependent oxidoreductase [Bradyrhizobium prioritasuperba]